MAVSGQIRSNAAQTYEQKTCDIYFVSTVWIFGDRHLKLEQYKKEKKEWSRSVKGYGESQNGVLFSERWSAFFIKCQGSPLKATVRFGQDMGFH